MEITKMSQIASDESDHTAEFKSNGWLPTCLDSCASVKSEVKISTISVEGHGDVKVTDLNPGSFLATGQGANTQRLAMRLLTQDDKDISEDMQANMSNVGLVAALLLTISVPSEVLEPGEGNAWGDNAKAAAQIHGLLLGICVIACVVTIMYSVGMMNQLAEIPSSGTKVFLVKLGPGKASMGDALWIIAIYSWFLAFILQFSLLYRAWCFYLMITISILAFITFHVGIMKHAQLAKASTLKFMWKGWDMAKRKVDEGAIKEKGSAK